MRQIANKVEQDYGKIDIVVANAAIQRWIPLLEMQDTDWRDVIDNNLNGTANTVRAFAPKMVARKKGRFILLSSMQGSMARKTHQQIVDATRSQMQTVTKTQIQMMDQMMDAWGAD